jgi:hypothetical protein
MPSQLFAAHAVYLKHEPRQIWPERFIVLFPDLHWDDDLVHLSATPFLERGRYSLADYPVVVWRHHVGPRKFARHHAGTGLVRHSQDVGIASHDIRVPTWERKKAPKPEGLKGGDPRRRGKPTHLSIAINDCASPAHPAACRACRLSIWTDLH